MTPGELIAQCERDWFVTTDDLVEIKQVVTQLLELLQDVPIGSEYRSDWEHWAKRRNAVLGIE